MQARSTFLTVLARKIYRKFSRERAKKTLANWIARRNIRSGINFLAKGELIEFPAERKRKA